MSNIKNKVLSVFYTATRSDITTGENYFYSFI